MESSPTYIFNSPTRKQTKNDTVSKVTMTKPFKSSIPMPAPATKREARSRSASSSLSQPVYRTQLPGIGVERGRTSASIPHPSIVSLKKQFVRPKTSSCPRNPYPNIRSKIDNGRSKSQCPSTNLCFKNSNKSIENIKKTNDENRYVGEKCSDEIIPRNDKQEEIMELCNILEEISGISKMKKKPLDRLDGPSRKDSFVKERTPQFLSSFEKQMDHISDSRYKLMYDVIINTWKASIGKSGVSRLSLPDPSLGLRSEIRRYLHNVPVEGEPLDEKLDKIEDEQVRANTEVMHHTVSLTKDYADLQDENSRLKKTQDKINFQQNEQMAILAQENKELDRKYALAVEKYNLEKSKVEKQEKSLNSILKEMLEIKKLLKFNEGKCNDLELRTKKADSAKRTLEVALRNMEFALEKEGKQHRQLFEKYSHSGEVINKLKYELEENKCITTSLEEKTRDLEMELKSAKASLDENQQKRNELVEELANKTKKLNELKEQLDVCKTNHSEEAENEVMSQEYASNLIVKDLTKNLQEKNSHVNELKKKQHQLESSLKEMATREKVLMKQVHDLMKNRSENDVVLKNQVQELQYKVKDLECDKAELEKILAQKTLELDQRDLMMREHAKLLQARDELIPMIKKKQDNEKVCTEKLMAVVLEHYNTYNQDDSNGKFGDQNPYRSLESLEKYYGLDPKMVDKELSFRQEKMTEMFNLLEYKQMEINKLERRIRELQGTYKPGNMIEKGFKSNKAKGLLSAFSGITGPINQ